MNKKSFWPLLAILGLLVLTLPLVLYLALSNQEIRSKASGRTCQAYGQTCVSGGSCCSPLVAKTVNGVCRCLFSLGSYFPEKNLKSIPTVSVPTPIVPNEDQVQCIKDYAICRSTNISTVKCCNSIFEAKILNRVCRCLPK